MTNTTHKKLLIAAAPLLFVFLWSTGFVVPRFSAPHAEPLTFLAIRFPIAAVAFALIALYLKAPWPKGMEIVHAIAVGALTHGLYLGAVYWAVAEGMPAGVSALIINLQPLLTALLAALIIGETIRRQHWIGLAIGLIGVAMVVWPKLSLTSTQGITPITVGVNALGAFGVALGTVYQKRFATKLHLASGGVWQYVGATIVVLIGAACTENFHFDGSPQVYFALAWSVIVLSIISVSLLMYLISQADVGRVSALIYLVPAVAAASAFVLFGETLNLTQLLGMAVCAVAVLIVLRSAPRQI